MAKTKNKNKGVTAGDLFGKLGRAGTDKKRADSDDIPQEQDEFDLMDDAIDVTSDSDSDSELDINALLKKYMPEQYDTDPSGAAEEPRLESVEQNKPEKGRGILSALKQTAAAPDPDDLMDAGKSADEISADEKLMDALDSAFSLPAEDDSLTPLSAGVDLPELTDEPEEPSFGSMNALARKMLGLVEEDAAEPDAEDTAPVIGKEPTAEPSGESEPPAFASLMSRMEQQFAEETDAAAESETPEESEPELLPDPGSSDNDELLADIAEPTEEDEEEVVNLFDEEKPRGLFGLFGRKKKKKEPKVSEEPVAPAAPEEEEAVLPDTVTELSDLLDLSDTADSPDLLTESGAEEAFDFASMLDEPDTSAEPSESAESAEAAEPAGEELPEAFDLAADAAEAADSADFAPDEPAKEAESDSLNRLFGDVRLEQLMSIETEAPADVGAEIPESVSDVPAEDSQAETNPISEEELEEMVRRMENDGETTEEEDDLGGIDPTDISLMVAFGMDEGSGKTSGKAKEFGDRLQQRQETASKNKVKLDRPEFVDKTQTPALRREYHRREVSLWIRLALCAVFTVSLFIFENIGLLTRLFTGSAKQFAGVFDPAIYPTVYIMASLQLMLLACVCAYDEILAGIRWLFRGYPKPQTMTALLTLVGIVYSAVTASLTVSPDEPVMFNFVTALAALLTLVCAIYNIKRERLNFRVVANKRPKHIVRRLQDEESEGETRAFEDAADVCDVMKIEKTDFVEGFFARLEKPDPATGTFMTCLMSIAVAVAILFGMFVKFRGGSGVEVVRVFYAAMLMVTPLSIYIAFSYPFYRANVEARGYDSAIIGESSLEEYSNASIISFDDKNVFPSYSVKVQNIRIYNNARIDRVLYYASSAFAYAGGPLQDVFEVATRDMGNSDNVKIFDTEAGFLATQVDGVNIIFGSYEALTARGLEIDSRAVNEDVDVSDELEIMYMFRESKLVAKMYVKYVMDPDIDPILKQFAGSGLYVCVRTFDPNIDERMIARKLNVKKVPLKIVRYASAEEVSRYEAKVDSGLVTCGTPKSLLQVISFCGKVLHSGKTNMALSVLSVLIGASIMLLLLLSNTIGSLSSFAIALYQAFWLITMSISSRAFIR